MPLDFVRLVASVVCGVKHMIYGLVDPRTNEVRYIGKTECGWVRPAAHRFPSVLRGRTHKENWLRGLKNSGYDYDIAVLELVSKEDSPALDTFEKFWIAQAKESGWPLTNETDGGDGKSGNRHTPESRLKMSLAHKGRSPSPEHRLHLSQANKGHRCGKVWPHTEETRRKKAENKKRWWASRTPEQLLEMSRKFSAGQQARRERDSK